MANLPKNKLIKIFVACGLLSVLIYSAFNAVLDNDFFAIDDSAYVLNNPMVKEGLTLRAVGQAFGSTELCNWHPLTWISHALDVSMFGMNPKGHHAVNLAFHWANGLLCFFLFFRITRSLPQAFLIALFFAIHPLRVESVAWISERKDVLSVFFAFLSLMCYLTYGQKKSVAAYLLCLGCLVLSLLTKAMFVTLPFVFLLLDYWPLKQLSSDQSSPPAKGECRAATRGCKISRQIRYLVIEKIPFFCVILIISIIAYHAQEQAGATFLAKWYPSHLRCENAAISYIRYIGKILYPTNLAVFYPLTFSALTIWQGFGASLFLIAATAAFLNLRKTMPPLIVGWLWYLGSLVPVIGLVQIGPQAMADRYTYFPCLGILLILVPAGAKLAARYPASKYILIAAAVVAASFFFITTSIQTTYWKDSLTLFRHTLRVTKENPLIGLLYGGQLELAREYQEAFEQYLRVHRQVPDQAVPLVHLSRVCMKQKKIPQAIHYARLACQTSNYQDPEVLKNLAHVLYDAGKPTEAMGTLDQALQLIDKDKQPELYAQLETLYNEILRETTGQK